MAGHSAAHGNSCYFHPKITMEIILEGVKFPRAGTLHTLMFFKSTYIIQALTSNYYGSACGIEHTLWPFGALLRNFSSLDTPPQTTLAFPRPHDTTDSLNSL